MNINSLQGVHAYTNAPNATPPINNTLRTQNVEASRTDLTTENTTAAREAFEVNITQEAQDRLAAQTAEAPEIPEAPEETQTTTPENQTNQTIATAREESQIVNIVA